MRTGIAPTPSSARRRKLLELTGDGADLVARAQGLARETDDIMPAELSNEQRRSPVAALAILATLADR
ncbi:hypothetical protein OG568_47530 [Streptomyces sp. NBC_01450]|uniref:hypothetical protein n=1 Tax=Streptomyces sp. NBC_01450 TaxID=2903871 RepID=UPI002E37F314|nr:hypothetical protein [Streptomyces sp. NBC_01450]